MTSREANANFDPVAHAYRWMEYLSFGRALEHCRNRFLPCLAECSSALVLGDGDGRFLRRLLAASPNLHADAVDTSAAMLRLLSRRAHSIPGSAARLRTHQASALTFTPTNCYDLIVTHFFLDCLTQAEVDALACRLTKHVTPGALWVVSDFRIPSGAMRLPSHAIVRLLYLAFRALTGLRTSALPNHAAALTAAGFAQRAHRHSLAGILTSELWEYTPAMLPPQKPKIFHPPDPVPDPEPSSPSLPEPDPGVFHPHEIPQTEAPAE